MKQRYFLFIPFFITFISFGQTIFINEIHYDNASTDANEGFEIAGPAGTDLAGYSVVFYNGSNGTNYAVKTLTGTITNQQNNMGTIWFGLSTNGMQNGSPDGLALVDPSSNVIQFLSYEGTFNAVGGPADGMLSTDIGVSESSTTPIGQSLQLIGTGTQYSDFTWSGPMASTEGLQNTGQTLPVTKNQIAGFAMYPNPVNNGKFVITTKNGANKQVEIYSMIGKQVYNKTVKANETIDVSNLNRGIYVLRVKENNKVATRKLIVD